MIRQQSIVKNFDQFSDSKEQEVKERAEKRCAERREKAEDLKAKKRKQNIWREQSKGRWNVEQTKRT